VEGRWDVALEHPEREEVDAPSDEAAVRPRAVEGVVRRHHGSPTLPRRLRQQGAQTVLHRTLGDEGAPRRVLLGTRLAPDAGIEPPLRVQDQKLGPRAEGDGDGSRTPSRGYHAHADTARLADLVHVPLERENPLPATDTELIPVVVAGDEDAEGSRVADGVDLGVHALLGVATALVEVEKGLVEDLLDGRSFQRGVVGHPRLVDVVAQEDDRRPPGQLAAPPRHQAQARLALGIRRSRVAQQDQAMVDLVVRHSGGLPLAPMERDLVAAGETADAEQEARAKPARDSSQSHRRARARASCGLHRWAPAAGLDGGLARRTRRPGESHLVIAWTISRSSSDTLCSAAAISKSVVWMRMPFTPHLPSEAPAKRVP
jgi:hypothetical protein